MVEFNDYEEMVDALSSSEYVQEAIKNLDEIDKQGVLIAFAKSFELKAPTKNAENWHHLSGTIIWKVCVSLMMLF